MAGAMDGIRVLDFGQIVSAPMAAMWLGDQGADVIKVESPAGDPLRTLGPRVGDVSAIFAAVNRGKRGVTLDLQTDAGRSALVRLIAWADVLFENFRPGVADRLGLGWEAARSINPRLVHCSISGYGADGPYANIRVYDPLIQATSGLAASQAEVAGRPMLMAGLIADKVTALTAAQAVTAALFARERSGMGQHVDVAMLDAALAFHWVEGMWNDSFVEPSMPRFPPYATLGWPLPCSDGHVIVSALQQVEADAMLRALGLEALIGDPRFATLEARLANREAWMAHVCEALSRRPGAEVTAACNRHGAVGAAINGVAEVADDPQVRHRQLVRQVPQDEAVMRAPRHPPRFSGLETQPPRAVPHLGEHNDLLATIS